MLSKTQKVNKKLFENTFKKNGKTFHSDFLYLKTDKQENKDAKSKFAFVIPKKIVKNATDRNLTKRRCFSVLRENKENIKKGFVAIFFLKKGAEKLNFEELQNQIIFLLKKSSLILNN